NGEKDQPGIRCGDAQAEMRACCGREEQDREYEIRGGHGERNMVHQQPAPDTRIEKPALGWRLFLAGRRCEHPYPYTIPFSPGVCQPSPTASPVAPEQTI